VIFAALMPKGPAVVRSPIRERQQFVIEQISWRSWSFDPFEVSGARNQLMPIGKDLASDKRGISKCTKAKHQIDPFGDKVDKPIGDQNLYPNVRVRCLERAEQRC